MKRGAALSKDGQYRYELTRRWSREPGAEILFIMLNPSTADHTVDDATIRRCVNYSITWGFSSLKVVNLFAYRATDRRVLKRVDDPIGPHNNEIVFNAVREHWPIVAAWGGYAPRERVEEVLSLLLDPQDLRCLNVTKNGHPVHPLRQPKSAVLSNWNPEMVSW